MASWVEKSARKHALILRDGPELWANLKVYLRQAVEDYTRIYTPTGEVEVQYSNCLQVTENCVRIRILAPPAKENVSLEIVFDPAKNSISWGKSTLDAAAEDDDVVVLKDKSGKSFDLEEISETILRPMLNKLPRRKPNITL
jgi:hypothetical protein